jgi:hypothetical protein
LVSVIRSISFAGCARGDLVVTTAIAREMVGFVRAIACRVQPQVAL